MADTEESTMGQRLAGRVAVITGGTSGIGEATVRLFVTQGASVVFCGRSQESGERIAADVGKAATFIRADVTHEAEIKATIALAVSKHGRLDCLFNNAGGSTPGTLEDVTVENFHYAMDLLLGSVIFGMRHATPIMKAQRSGRIINNSSIAALRTGRGPYLYSAAKAAVTQITRVAGMELGPYSITVNSISPGAIATPIFWRGAESGRRLEPAHEEAKMRKLKTNLGNANPLGRSGVPEDIANAALFLASDEGAFVNCHDLVVDGGMTAGSPTYS